MEFNQVSRPQDQLTVHQHVSLHGKQKIKLHMTQGNDPSTVQLTQEKI